MTVHTKNKKQIRLLRNQGFSLIEVIAVLVILGILTTVVVNRMSMNNTDLYSLESSFRSHIRYAQSKAMQNDTRVWGIRISAAGDDYWLFNCNINQSCGWSANRTLFPGETATPASMGVNIGPVTVDSSSRSYLTLVFDEMGVPFWADGSGAITFADPLSGTSGLTRLTSNISIGLDDGAGNQRSITIIQETGFVQ